MPIHIDLNNLTQAHIDEAAPHIRQCTYSSPCIIGALMKPVERAEADDVPPDDMASYPICELIRMGKVAVPIGQGQEAQELQVAFDNGNVDQLAELLAKRGLKWPYAEAPA